MIKSFMLATTVVLAMAAGPIVIFIYAATGPLLLEQFGLNTIDFGRLVSLAFVSAAICSIAVGALVDRFTPVTTLLILHTLATVSILLGSLSTSLTTLVSALVLSGFVQALGNPLTNRIIATGVAPRYRNIVTGIKQSGVQLSQFSAGAVAAPIAVAFGWAFSFLAAAPIIVLGAIFGIISLRRVENPVTYPSCKMEGSRLPRAIWQLALYAILTGAAMQATLAYITIFMVDIFEISTGIAGLAISIIGITGVVSRIFWSYYVDRAKSIAVTLTLVAFGGFLSITLIIVALFLGMSWLVWAGLLILGLTGVSANAIVMIGAISVSNFDQIGRASGIIGTGLFVGFALGPTLFGLMTTLYHDYIISWSGIAVLYLLAAMTLLPRASRSRTGGARALHSRD